MAAAHELPVILTPDEDGGFVVECPVIPGCISQGDTRDEALANIREAIELCLENQAAEGWTLPGQIEITKVAVWRRNAVTNTSTSISAVRRIDRRVPRLIGLCIGTVTGIRPGHTRRTWLPFCRANS
jgi:predicted RNase H-like HicB family nuclease